MRHGAFREHVQAWQHYGVKPDVMTVAKALGNGLPVGADFLPAGKAASAMVPGDHGTTYGRQPAGDSRCKGCSGYL